MGFRRISRLVALASALFGAAPLLACTLCHSAPAALIRARLLGADLWWNLCVTAIPILLLLAIVALVAREPAA